MHNLRTVDLLDWTSPACRMSTLVIFVWISTNMKKLLTLSIVNEDCNHWGRLCEWCRQQYGKYQSNIMENNTLECLCRIAIWGLAIVLFSHLRNHLNILCLLMIVKTPREHAWMTWRKIVFLFMKMHRCGIILHLHAICLCYTTAETRQY